MVKSKAQLIPGEQGTHRRSESQYRGSQIARQLRSRTTMTLKWIAQRLRMGTWTYVSNCLGQRRRRAAETGQCR